MYRRKNNDKTSNKNMIGSIIHEALFNQPLNNHCEAGQTNNDGNDLISESRFEDEKESV